MDDYLAGLCVVENDIYGFVVKHYDTRSVLECSVIEQKLFIYSEMEIFFKRDYFSLSSAKKCIGLFEYAGEIYLVKHSPDFLDVPSISEIWSMNNLSSFGLVGALDYIFANFENGYAGLLEEIVVGYDLYLEKKHLNGLISDVVIDKRVVKV